MLKSKLYFLLLGIIISIFPVEKANSEEGYFTDSFFELGTKIEVKEDTCQNRTGYYTRPICFQIRTSKPLSQATLKISVVDNKDVTHNGFCYFYDIQPHKIYEDNCKIINTSPIKAHYSKINIMLHGGYFK